jgi:hypothetical protein
LDAVEDDEVVRFSEVFASVVALVRLLSAESKYYCSNAVMP